LEIGFLAFFHHKLGRVCFSRRYSEKLDGICDTTFDPLTICFGVRIQIEKLIYDKISDAENRRIFIEEINGTKNKLLFAQSINVQVPETFFARHCL